MDVEIYVKKSIYEEISFSSAQKEWFMILSVKTLIYFSSRF